MPLARTFWNSCGNTACSLPRRDGEFLQPFGGAADYRNILCVLPGSDPTLRSESILVGGHYDHVGYGTARNSRGPVGLIHNGADDNASGTATLLELIRVLQENRVPHRRSLLFAFWDAEEKNLLGSKHFVSAPTVPLQNIRFVFNIDMVGRLSDDEGMEMLGTRTAVGLRRFAADNNDQQLKLIFNWDIINDSDHFPFVARNIPYLMPFTNKHDDYHRPSDDANKVNYPGMQRIGRHMLRLVESLSNTNRLPVFRDRSRVETDGVRKQFERPLPDLPPRLGMSTQRVNETEVQVVRIITNTTAARAGFQLGDRIEELAGRAIRPENFQRAGSGCSANNYGCCAPQRRPNHAPASFPGWATTDRNGLAHGCLRTGHLNA